jgi:hypothetical protein
MLDLDLFCNLGTLATVQLLGMASAWLARLSEGTAHQARFQRFFFVSLVVVGGATMVSLRLPPVYWLISAVTFTLMIMVVVCDFSRSGQTESFASGVE